MTFVVTWCGPENSINRTPNSPSLPVNVDFMVTQYGKNMLRSYFTKKVFHRTKKRKYRETREMCSEPDCVNHKVLPPQKKENGRIFRMLLGTITHPWPQTCATHTIIPFSNLKTAPKTQYFSVSHTRGPATDISRKHEAACQQVNQLHHLRVLSSMYHPGPEGNNLMWKKTVDVKMEKGEATIETQPQLERLSELNCFPPDSQRAAITHTPRLCGSHRK